MGFSEKYSRGIMPYLIGERGETDSQVEDVSSHTKSAQRYLSLHECHLILSC